MRYGVLFVMLLLTGSVVSAQEVGTQTDTPPAALTSVLSDSVSSAQAILDGIRLQLLEELNIQARATSGMHVDTPYEPIINTVFGGGATTASEGSTPDHANSTCAAFTQSFDVGDSGTEVVRIQQFLNSLGGDTRVAESGPGSSGNETEYYGSKTFLAVWAFQQKYKDDILTPLGLSAPTGYWGASTRAKANELQGCVQ
jgi:hypothetical protein